MTGTETDGHNNGDYFGGRCTGNSFDNFDGFHERRADGFGHFQERRVGTFFVCGFFRFVDFGFDGFIIFRLRRFHLRQDLLGRCMEIVSA